MSNVMQLAVYKNFEEQECWSCGVLFAITPNLAYAKKRDNATLYCPNGCKLSLGESDESKLRKQLAERERQLAFERERAATNLQAREKAEKEAKRLKKRISGGSCPCCNRSFTNVQRHIATKHPEFVNP